MWALIGVALAGLGAALGWRNRTARTPNAYAGGEYGLTRGSHTAFALASAAFVALFACAGRWAPAAVVPALAVYVLLFVFYASSFARGFSDQ